MWTHGYRSSLRPLCPDLFIIISYHATHCLAPFLTFDLLYFYFMSVGTDLYVAAPGVQGSSLCPSRFPYEMWSRMVRQDFGRDVVRMRLSRASVSVGHSRETGGRQGIPFFLADAFWLLLNCHVMFGGFIEPVQFPVCDLRGPQRRLCMLHLNSCKRCVL